MITRAAIKLAGIVQGVGFRPFVHRLSKTHKLNGFIANTSSGVDIEVEGSRPAIHGFYEDLGTKLPPLARITAKKIRFLPVKRYHGFTIRESRKHSTATALISPDIGTCDRCKKELFDPSNRRFRYPFINCTDCGPRFSILEGLPYDRAFTTMKNFTLCPRCRKEYESIDNRRYHAQPNACGECGPAIELLKDGKRVADGDTAVREACRLLAGGAIIAIKGISGFHLACNALDTRAVRRLRDKKQRPSKPFAVMAPDAAGIRKFCALSQIEERLIFSPERPIVLLRKRADPRLTPLSPDNNYLGVMAPYSPLHYLLCAPGNPPRARKNRGMLLVMTSANEADEPVETSNNQALSRLAGVCDYFLLHNRTIANRCDDSIAQVIDHAAVVLRRGRGYSPFPFLMNKSLRATLACGAELKNTFCLCKNRYAFLSHYIGDLSTYPVYSFYMEAVERLSRLFAVKPKLIACDFHPDYLSTRYAQDRKKQDPAVTLIPVQHHEAHIASVIAEHTLTGKVIGVCFDGTGYGTDQTIWGGEFFTGTPGALNRAASLAPVPMPGGDKATREPYRMGISYLLAAFGDPPERLNINFTRKWRKQIHPLTAVARASAVRTSSCGRLFDAVSAILGICDIISYEAQAAIRLQMYAEKSRTHAAYRFDIAAGKPLRIMADRMIRELVADIREGVSAEICARKFHNGLSRITAHVCATLRRSTGINTVCLSGGVFQNKLLLETLTRLLRKNGFSVFANQLVPTNDGAVSLGQAIIANARIKKCV